MSAAERVRIHITGAVQGVGFRPFIYRLAADHGIAGWVNNSAQGVLIEAEAAQPQLARFVQGIAQQKPPHAAIHTFDTERLPPAGYTRFEIHHSESEGVKSAFILPDLAICPDCLREITDPTNRRYRYPFTNCTHCGPRFSIIRALPYDRPNTTMRAFVMCDDCQAEYEDPLDRRFHAQPNACPHCGPQLALWDHAGRVLAEKDEALRAAEDALRRGQIVAVKGLGGFHLMVDARSSEAVALLRARKGRYEKPLAVMFPSLEQVKAACDVSQLEHTLLVSSEAPIVLLRYRGGDIAPEVAPENPYLGVMLPYTPLHYLLLDDLGFPVVATSGNLSGEPICTGEHEALAKLGATADLFLVHNRPIARHVDDSVVCVAAGAPLILRRARGYAPLPIDLSGAHPTLVAVGAQQKTTTALLHQGSVFLSQHLGDMDNVKTFEAFKHTLADFETLYDANPSAVVCDLHPDYLTTQYAEQIGLPVLKVQHHEAHVLSCMAEHHLEAPVLGVAWDGTGCGSDGMMWGGEFLLVENEGFQRVAHLRPFPLPGGDAAAREPRRSLLGVLYAMYGGDLPRERLDFTPHELKLLLTALDKHINSPLTSSMGRLFDAAAALVGLRQKCSFEGQAAMALEYAALQANSDECYPYEITPVTNADQGERCIIEWKPIFAAMLNETIPARMSAKFHNTLAMMVVETAQRVGTHQVALTGGCFQNRVLLERCIGRLRAAGFTPYWQQRIPPNDGGIALGQIAAAIRGGNHVFGSSGQAHQHQRRGT
jgi:hydrogenase maturation protein HypF